MLTTPPPCSPNILGENAGRDAESLLHDGWNALHNGKLSAALSCVNDVLNGRKDVTPAQSADAIRLLQEMAKKERDMQAAPCVQENTIKNLQAAMQTAMPLPEKTQKTPASPPQLFAKPLRERARPSRRRQNASRAEPQETSEEESLGLSFGADIYDCLLALLGEKHGALITHRYLSVKDFCLALTENTTSKEAREELSRLVGVIDDSLLKIVLRDRLSTILTAREIMSEADQKQLQTQSGIDDD